MYEELVKRLREYAKEHCPLDRGSGICGCIDAREAADAIEERDRYALTLQREMMAEAESHIALVERLNKQIEELQKEVAYWQAQLIKSMCGEALAELEKPRWIPVTEKNHPKAYEPVMVIYVGWNDALPHRDCTAYWSEDEGLWRWAETNDKVKVAVTHYMPLPPLPEPTKEET